MKISDLTVGIDFKRCSECEYKNNDIREELLVIAGARAAYMDDAGHINIPSGVEGEHELAHVIANLVDRYLRYKDDTNFDLYIESALVQKFGR